MNASAGPLHNQAACQAIGTAQGNCANDFPAQQLLDLQNQGLAPVRNNQSFVESRQFAGERYVDYRAADA
jgi:hypothetical protein